MLSAFSLQSTRVGQVDDAGGVVIRSLQDKPMNMALIDGTYIESHLTKTFKSQFNKIEFQANLIKRISSQFNTI